MSKNLGGAAQGGAREILNTTLTIVAILASLVGPFLPALLSPGSQETVAKSPLFEISNPFLPEYWGSLHVLYAVNFGFALAFVCIWLGAGYLRQDPRYFSRMWTFTWIGLALYYLYRLLVTGGSLQPRFDIILNNVNTAFLLLAYVGLAYPKNTDYRKRPRVFQRFFKWVVGAFFLLALVSALAPGQGGLFVSKVLSGCYAGLAFCFFAARLESLLHRQYALVAVAFLYAFVQVFWSFEGVQAVLPSGVVFALALVGKVVLGLLVLTNYSVIAARATQYFDVKEDSEAQQTSPLDFRRAG